MALSCLSPCEELSLCTQEELHHQEEHIAYMHLVWSEIIFTDSLSRRRSRCRADMKYNANGWQWKHQLEHSMELKGGFVILPVFWFISSFFSTTQTKITPLQSIYRETLRLKISNSHKVQISNLKWICYKQCVLKTLHVFNGYQKMTVAADLPSCCEEEEEEGELFLVPLQ